MRDEKPMFIQIVEMIRDDILAEIYQEGDLIISTPQISKLLSVNPATAQRAISVLSDQGIIEKKRGIGMAVACGARAAILAEQQANFHEKVVPEFIARARKIGIGGDELLKIVKESCDD
ncbi:MAG: GntR family transcriptional regulator [Clostridiales bacterium]|jgi:DNA-binding transcriptional regulator YhcF (GntR family)|nr:GntR family transcriptional regulator [Clostridiales bacterium]